MGDGTLPVSGGREPPVSPDPGNGASFREGEFCQPGPLSRLAFHYSYERLFQPYVRAVEVNGLGDPYIPLRKIWLERSP